MTVPGTLTAAQTLDATLHRIERIDPSVGAMVDILSDRARDDARGVDAARAAGIDPGPLAGRTFAVKALFDVAGLRTTAGAGMLDEAPAAQVDATALKRLRAAGGVLVGTCNMDEFAYGFVTINARYGTTRNPHDLTRLAGGSSGGSAAAVAAGLVPIALGSDTNGSIRVPASLCGVYGIKPAHGALPMGGVYPFVEALDDIGPLTARLEDLRLVYGIMAGQPVAETNPARLRVARLGGWFERKVSSQVAEAMSTMFERLALTERTELPNVERARSAAYVITAVAGGALHPPLRANPLAFDPAVRDRLIAGALLPAAAYLRAVEIQIAFRERVAALFETVDVLVAPATPDVAPTINNAFIEVERKKVPARANLGILTQPISLAALPVVAAPLLRPGKLPLGIQLIGAPGREHQLFAYARFLEERGLIGFSPPEPTMHLVDETLA